jgi:cytidine deaminase
MIYVTYTELDDHARTLCEIARQASNYAYSPYSKRKVGAAVRTLTGSAFMGCNVENSSYGLTCCAERVAIFTAVATDGSLMRITEIAVYANTNSAAPCGACLQVIAEFGNDTRILFSNLDRVVDTTITEMLPGRRRR